MIFSFNANAFGPGTNSLPGDMLESALDMFRRTGIRTAAFASRVDPGSLTTQDGLRMDLQAVTQHRHLHFVFPSSRLAVDAVRAMPVLADRAMSLESATLTDRFDGREESQSTIVTNFPILRNDWRRSKVFSTHNLEMRDNVREPGDYAARVGSELYVSSANVLFLSPAQPLYQNGGLLLASAEPFGDWADTAAMPPSVRAIDDPVLYMSHPFSGNFNIFFHETILAVLELDLLPPNTKVLVRTDPFRIDAMRRLGVPQHRILSAGPEPLLLRQVLIPQRRLNLKYVGARLDEMYKRLTASLRSERGPLRHAGRLVYLDRRTSPRNTGANRFVINEQEVTEGLARRGAVTVYLEDYNLVEKSEILSGADTIVTAIGANLVNVALSDNIRRIVLIATPLWGHFVHYWKSVLQMRHPHIDVVVFADCEVEDNGLSKDPFNKPYRIQVDRLLAMV